MARTALTPAQRSSSVAAAYLSLKDALEPAILALHTHGPTDARTLAAWETVEQYGAVIHRQSRLLAGKTKGG